MSFADHYFSKQKDFVPCPVGIPSGQLRFIVVIPACREPDVISTLESLHACDRPNGDVEIMVVLNLPENASRADRTDTLQALPVIKKWMDNHTTAAFRFFLLEYLTMPEKDAGVGLARKTGMDQALYRFNRLGNPHGFILSFDADSLCSPNYFTGIEASVKRLPQTNGFNLYFEHPVMGNEFSETHYRGIILYEMHLRYLNQETRETGFPYAFHTIGSCFGVRADAYAEQGGMNRKKAGEDFYFLHKIIPLGHFIEINEPCVYPSARESDRVPFGTGAAVRKFMQNGKEEMLTYSPSCFHDLKLLFEKVPNLKNANFSEIMKILPAPLAEFLTAINAVDSVDQIKANSASVQAFANRFYRWFDAFRIIKYIHYASAASYPRIPVEKAVCEFLQRKGVAGISEKAQPVELLELMREIERGI